MSVYASANAIQARARTLDPVKLLVTVVSVLPYLLFGLLRLAWFVVSILIAAGMEGWDAAGRRLPTARPDRGG